MGRIGTQWSIRRLRPGNNVSNPNSQARQRGAHRHAQAERSTLLSRIRNSQASRVLRMTAANTHPPAQPGNSGFETATTALSWEFLEIPRFWHKPSPAWEFQRKIKPKTTRNPPNIKKLKAQNQSLYLGGVIKRMRGFSQSTHKPKKVDWAAG